MTTDNDPLFPEAIPDCTAAVLTEFLYALAGECEARYASQLHRYYAKHHHYYDPDHPWISRPSDPDL